MSLGLLLAFLLSEHLLHLTMLLELVFEPSHGIWIAPSLLPLPKRLLHGVRLVRLRRAALARLGRQWRDAEQQHGGDQPPRRRAS